MSKRNGKGKGKAFDSVIEQRMRASTTDPELRGSLKKGLKVMAKFEDINWKVAEVIEVSLSDSYKEKKAAANSAAEENKDDDDKKKFKYYIHFIGENRRLDKWVVEDEINLDAARVEKEYKLVKE